MMLLLPMAFHLQLLTLTDPLRIQYPIRLKQLMASQILLLSVASQNKVALYHL